MDPVWMFLPRFIEHITLKRHQTLYIAGADNSYSGLFVCFGTSVFNKPFYSIGSIKGHGE